ncbi:hypothetical protein LTT66_32485 [Nocardia gipuzkoensis]|uniref:hypothetical protein n=1 Tax=Nocardia gipuzkoensis TaxID=2749991 RepID=UPI001E544E22|nr:hypothetical protein [Nocardia gipuzkoensis]UGT67847.1 hypothetical protein LTT66_32485 [Nocardia gipuzkoensis]
MKLIGWLRLGGLTLALLAAALLMAPLMHCTLLDAGEHHHGAAAHSHDAATPITALVAAAVDGTSHVLADAGGRHGAPHAVHCAITPALPAGGGSFVPLQLLLFVLVVGMVVAAVYRVCPGGVRGPPVAAVPVVSGRVLLTRICIARR